MLRSEISFSILPSNASRFRFASSRSRCALYTHLTKPKSKQACFCFHSIRALLCSSRNLSGFVVYCLIINVLVCCFFLSSSATFIGYHVVRCLSRTFFIFFSNFQGEDTSHIYYRRFILALVSSDLLILSSKKAFVNAFFVIFLIF
jgi:hypothetical protein